MYKGEYSGVKYGMDSSSKSKDCGYYVKYFFVFSSLIQFLIILGLVLFMLYGTDNKMQGDRLTELEEKSSQLFSRVIVLDNEKQNLTTRLNQTQKEKKALDAQLVHARGLITNSSKMMGTISRDLSSWKQTALQNGQCCQSSPCARIDAEKKVCIRDKDQLTIRHQTLEINFTTTIGQLFRELRGVKDERDSLRMLEIKTRQEKQNIQTELEDFKEQCRTTYESSLKGITDITSKFNEQINKALPNTASFSLSCENQHQQMERIRANCSLLKSDIESKYQSFVDSISRRLSDIQSQNSNLKIQTEQNKQRLELCSRNRTETIKDYEGRLRRLQDKHDTESLRIIREIQDMRLEKDRLLGTIAGLESQVKNLTSSVKPFNPAYPRLPPLSGFPQGSSSAESNTLREYNAHYKALQDFAQGSQK
ncbi:plasmalemma vesicle associated protein b [Erpetoichthys calabaricus]|uniref:Plasmalemma vesicle associated protein b n=1 Tax=Erpetoichthys calabaricus TaxID=27687 RepID=A0A8C4SZP5_ERPCA|nr:plasmalemma vesicle associated protein b [Erpetoichthys calabaricus]